MKKKREWRSWLTLDRDYLSRYIDTQSIERWRRKKNGNCFKTCIALWRRTGHCAYICVCVCEHRKGKIAAGKLFKLIVQTIVYVWWSVSFHLNYNFSVFFFSLFVVRVFSLFVIRLSFDLICDQSCFFFFSLNYCVHINSTKLCKQTLSIFWTVAVMDFFHMFRSL